MRKITRSTRFKGVPLKIMVKKTTKFFELFLLVCFIFLNIAESVQAGFPSMYEKDLTDQQRSLNDSDKKRNIDELLGPEENFPFLPENHRDNSNPIGRIGSISNQK